MKAVPVSLLMLVLLVGTTVGRDLYAQRGEEGAAAMLALLTERVNNLEKQVRAKASENSFVGMVMPFPGDADKIPAEYLVCDGRELARDQYPLLFSKIGYIYGGSGGGFKLPDYRGYFLRGVDGGSKHDPDAATRATAGGQVGDFVGSLQSYATALPHKPFKTGGKNDGKHSHKRDAFDRMVTANNQITVLMHDNTVNLAEPNLSDSRPMSEGFHSHTIAAGGDLESRPVNVSVYWVIRVK